MRHGEEDGGTVAESYREDVAAPGRRGGDAGKSTIRKTQLAGPPQRVQKAEWLTAV